MPLIAGRVLGRLLIGDPPEQSTEEIGASRPSLSTNLRLLLGRLPPPAHQAWKAAADSDGVIHVAHRQDLLPSGGLDAVAAAELPIMLAYGEALAGTGKPLVTAGSIGSPGNLERPATEEDPALPAGEEHKGTMRVRNVYKRSCILVYSS